jgi:hypothetical protein
LDAVKVSSLCSPQRPSLLPLPGGDGSWAEVSIDPRRDAVLRRCVERIRRGGSIPDEKLLAGEDAEDQEKSPEESPTHYNRYPPLAAH